ncbi:MAG: hypothetical protein ACTH7J_13965 [Glutamicibacter ardleyensis]
MTKLNRAPQPTLVKFIDAVITSHPLQNLRDAQGIRALLFAHSSSGFSCRKTNHAKSTVIMAMPRTIGAARFIALFLWTN